MSLRARVLFVVASMILLLIFEVLIVRGRSEEQIEFDQTVEDIFRGVRTHSVVLEMQRGAVSLVVVGDTAGSEDVLRVLSLMSAADIFSKGGGDGGAESCRFTVRIDGGVREFSVWVARSVLESDLRTRNLLKVFQLLGQTERVAG